jgi:hypothetical protein
MNPKSNQNLQCSEKEKPWSIGYFDVDEHNSQMDKKYGKEGTQAEEFDVDGSPDISLFSQKGGDHDYSNSDSFSFPSTRVVNSQGSNWSDTISKWTPPRDLKSLEVAPKFAVEGLIQSGKVGALIAAGGTGKTTLIMTLAICIAVGRPFLGRKVKHGTFVIISNDDSQSDLDGAFARVIKSNRLSEKETNIALQKVRVISLQETGESVTFTSSKFGVVQTTVTANTLIRALSNIDDLVGISLDTLRQFSGGSSNDEQVIKLLVMEVTRLANRTGAFVILPHHTGKQNYREVVTDMYAGSGSAAIADNCRFILVLQSTNWNTIDKKIKRTGCENGDPLILTPTRESLLMKMCSPTYLFRDDYLIDQICGESQSKQQDFNSRDIKILEAVLNGSKSKNAVCTVVGGKKESVLLSISTLIDRKLLATMQSIAHGKSSELKITELGQQAIRAGMAGSN